MASTDKDQTTEDLVSALRAELEKLEATIPALQKDVLDGQAAYRRHHARVTALRCLLESEEQDCV